MNSVDPHQQVLISTKAIIRNNERVLLVKNARSEWELQEELRITSGASKVVDAFKHHHYQNIIVIVYDCGMLTNPNYSLSDEHSDGGWFTLEQTAKLNIPEHYQRVISQVCGA